MAAAAAAAGAAALPCSRTTQRRSCSAIFGVNEARAPGAGRRSSLRALNLPGGDFRSHSSLRSNVGAGVRRPSACQGVGSGRQVPGKWGGAVTCRAVEEDAGGAGRGPTGGWGAGGDGSQGGWGPDEPDDTPEGRAATGIALLWNKYLEALETNPVPTKATTAMLLNFFGDLCCQLVVEKAERLDARRLAVTAVLGFVLVGPALHFWYYTLSRVVTATGTGGTLVRLCLDQFLFSPVFICVFFAALLSLEGRPRDIGPKLRQDFVTTCVTNWKLWIPFQFLNFRLVPLNLQVAAANVIALAWNIYLSFAGHSKVQSEPIMMLRDNVPPSQQKVIIVDDKVR